LEFQVYSQYQWCTTCFDWCGHLQAIRKLLMSEYFIHW
jgi:hypothetical protein